MERAHAPGDVHPSAALADEPPNALRVLPHEILHVDPPGAFGSVPRSRDAIREVSGFRQRDPFARIVRVLSRGAVSKVQRVVLRARSHASFQHGSSGCHARSRTDANHGRGRIRGKCEQALCDADPQLGTCARQTIRLDVKGMMGTKGGRSRADEKRREEGRAHATPPRPEFGFIVDDRDAQVYLVRMCSRCAGDRKFARTERWKEIENVVAWHPHRAKLAQNLADRATDSSRVVVQLFLFPSP